MGVYWLIVCDECKEFINLNDVNGCGDKIYNIGPALVCAAALSCLGNWAGLPIRLLNDSGINQDRYYDIKGLYRNVTAEAVKLAQDLELLPSKRI